MRKRKVLIIARDFIPFSSTLGGILRVLKMAEFFNSQGFDVFILSAEGEKISPFGYQKAVKNLNIYYRPEPLKEL